MWRQCTENWFQLFAALEHYNQIRRLLKATTVTDKIHSDQHTEQLAGACHTEESIRMVTDILRKNGRIRSSNLSGPMSHTVNWLTISKYRI